MKRCESCQGSGFNIWPIISISQGIDARRYHEVGLVPGQMEVRGTSCDKCDGRGWAD